MAAISIAVVSDTKQAVQSVKDLSADYSSLADTLRTLGPDGESAADELEEAMRRAQLATQDASAASRDLVTQVGRAQESATRLGPMAMEGIAPVGEEVEKTGVKAESLGEKFEQVGERGLTGSKIASDAVSNLGFSAMSAGSMLEGPGGILEALGSFIAFGSMTFAEVPLLGAAVAGLGIGMSLLGTKMQSTAGSAGAEAQAVSALASQIDAADVSAHTLAENTVTVQDALKKAASSGKVYGESLADIRDAASSAGVSQTSLTLAMAGNAQALDQTLPAMRQYSDSLRDRIAAEEQAQRTAAASHQSLSAAELAQMKADQQNLASSDQMISVLKQRSKAASEAAAEQEAIQRAQASEMGMSVSQYKAYEGALSTASAQNLTLTKAQKDQIESSAREGASVKELRGAVASYASALSAASAGGVSLTAAQKEQVAEAAQAGVSAKDLSGAVASYASELTASKNAQASWNSAVGASFRDATNASSDWAKSQKVSFGQMETNQKEVLDSYARFPAAMTKLTAEGLSDAGKTYAESVLTPEQIEQLSTVSTKTRASIIAQWNALGADSAKGLADGIAAPKLKMPSAKIKVDADTTAARSTILTAAQAKYVATIKAHGETAAAQQEIADAATAKYVATIRAHSELGDSQERIEKAAAAKYVATIKAHSELGDSQERIEKAAAAQYVATIKAHSETGDAEKSLDATASKKRTSTVVADVDLSAFNRKIQEALRPRTMTITVNQVAGKRVGKPVM